MCGGRYPPSHKEAQTAVLQAELNKSLKMSYLVKNCCKYLDVGEVSAEDLLHGHLDR